MTFVYSSNVQTKVLMKQTEIMKTRIIYIITYFKKSNIALIKQKYIIYVIQIEL